MCSTRRGQRGNGKALEEAKSAWKLRQEDKLEESDASAETALQYLKAR